MKNKPIKRLQITPGRAALVDGFESSFGLDLLSTVHWVMKHESVTTLDEVVERVYAWSPRKRRFTLRQIGIAAGVLAKTGWTSPLDAQVCA